MSFFCSWLIPVGPSSNLSGDFDLRMCFRGQVCEYYSYYDIFWYKWAYGYMLDTRISMCVGVYIYTYIYICIYIYIEL